MLFLGYSEFLIVLDRVNILVWVWVVNLGYKILGVFNSFKLVEECSYCWLVVIFGWFLVVVMFFFIKWLSKVDLLMLGILMYIVWIVCFCIFFVCLVVNWFFRICWVFMVICLVIWWVLELSVKIGWLFCLK